MSKKLFYPAVFEPEDNNSFSVYFPDIQGCNTCGEYLEEAYEMAQDVLALMLSYMHDHKEEIPNPSNPQDIKLKDNQFIIVVEFDMLEYLKKTKSHAVKKTLSIPSWLNERAIEAGINFSQVLQEALIKKVGTMF
jgi:predicted RNase H-like HicB family nuclease